eukprot:GEMP01058783.1.p1 GENE.GEMP01058783.1~~GEMP01058783.1.p1  ORF type:complete len:306 (+),score=86.62 GEMP01058783.1:342-1259(+)
MEWLRNYQRRQRLGLEPEEVFRADSLDEILDIYRRDDKLENVEGGETVAELSHEVQSQMESLSMSFSDLNRRRREVQGLEDSKKKLIQSVQAIEDANEELREKEKQARVRIRRLQEKNKQLVSDVHELKQHEALDNNRNVILQNVLSDTDEDALMLPTLDLRDPAVQKAWHHFCTLLEEVEKPHQCQADIYDTHAPRCERCQTYVKSLAFLAEEVGHRAANPPPLPQPVFVRIPSLLHPDTDDRPVSLRTSSSRSTTKSLYSGDVKDMFVENRFSDGLDLVRLPDAQPRDSAQHFAIYTPPDSAR